MKTNKTIYPIRLLLNGVFGLALLLLQGNARAEQLDVWQVRKQIDPTAIIAFGNNTFVVACPGQVLVSSNGTDWNAYLPPMFNAMLAGITFGNGQFLLSYTYERYSPSADTSTTNSGVYVYSSLDGIRWKLRLFQENPSGIIWYSKVAAGNGQFVVSSQDLVVSTNLTEWDTVIPDFQGGFSDLSFADGFFMGSLWYGGIAMSSDGWLWAYQESLAGLACSSVRHANGTFVGFQPGANDSSYPPAVALSGDGVNWSATLLPDYTNAQALASAGNRFFLFNSISNGFYSSLDGRSWQLHASGTGIQISDIVYGANTFVAVGSGVILQSALATNAPASAAPSISIRSLPAISLTGTVGQHYIIEYTEDLQNTNAFQALTNLFLPTSPLLWVDADAVNHSQRFYRAVLAP